MDERHTFTECLYSNYLNKRKVFLELTGKKSKMLYETGPLLEDKYMEIFGEQEKTVIEAELNAQLAKELYEKIRSLVNRREAIDPAALKEEFLKKREEKLKEINSTNSTDVEQIELDEVDKAKIDSIYKFMTGALHPALNPEQTEEEKELYNKVVDAYKNKDLDSLQTLREVFFKGDDMATYIKNTMLEDTELSVDSLILNDDDESEAKEIRRRKKTGIDFSLASKIFDAFELSLKDHEYLDLIKKLDDYIEEEKAEIEQLKNTFPFTTAEMLASESGIATYADELKVRLKTANDDYHYYQEKINQAIGGKANV